MALKISHDTENTNVREWGGQYCNAQVGDNNAVMWACKFNKINQNHKIVLINLSYGGTEELFVITESFLVMLGYA